MIQIPWNPDRRMLRQFAGLWLVLFGSLAAAGLLRDGSNWHWWLLVACVGGVSGLIRPEILKPVFVSWMILAWPVGWVVSHGLLLAVYYGVFTPAAVLLRLTGYDPLQLRKPKRDSYWIRRTPVTDLRRYLKQF